MTELTYLADYAREALGIGPSPETTLRPLPARGSDRTFYRFTWSGDKTAIVIDYDPRRTENTYYADIAAFLGSSRIPVPRLIGHDPERHIMIMEDMGNDDLWSFRERPWDERRPLYQKTLSTAKRLHSISENNFPSERIRLMEGFGPNLYRFERIYFLDHFVKGLCNINPDPDFTEKLEAELAALGERLDARERSLIHRDLQSRNVMVRDGETYLIDFQGMRFGSPFYDLGSLLCDPYVSLSEDEREDLLSFYYVLSSQELDWDAFQGSFWEASVQRLMQALGAYGFLGKVKGLEDFLGNVPAGLENLRLAASHVPALSSLQGLITECRMAMEL
ncbi:MAG TPA: phosphotransferase [Syntrophorhabdaceae bacterium]|nr:phosphotransferase [Syntrophorhabdaceae bacterium]